MARVCKVDGCGREHHGLGYCEAHYTRVRRHRTPLADRPLFTAAMGCAVGGCERKHHSFGHCRVHAQRLKQHGDPRADVPVREARRWFGRYNTAASTSAFDPVDTDEL